MQPLRTLFLCRGSIQHGLGHVVRSKKVATAMQPDADVRMVVVGDSFARNLLVDSPLEYQIVAHPRDAVAAANEFSPDIVVFDLIHLEESIFHGVAGGALKVGLSPVFDRMDQLDLLFHRTSERGPWDDRGNGAGPAIRSGLDYAIVGDHCDRIAEEVYTAGLRAGPLSVAVSMGGTDAANKTLAVLNVLRESDRKLLVWVLLGEGYIHSYHELVEALHSTRHEIILAKTYDSMWRILKTCALAILAGGTTTYEAAYAGLPSINTLESGDRYFLIKELIEAEVCRCAGLTFEESLDAMPTIVSELAGDRDALVAMHRNSSGLIDGLGARRIVDEILAAHQARGQAAPVLSGHRTRGG